MATDTIDRFKTICASADFIPVRTVEDYRFRAQRELEALDSQAREVLLSHFELGLRDFEVETCPGCGKQGYYRWGRLGQMNHPACGWTWYVSPSVFLRRSWRRSSGLVDRLDGEASRRLLTLLSVFRLGAALVAFPTRILLVWIHAARKGRRKR